ncbi:hypothetical protein VI26_17710 [Chromobacterium sp. LK1]|uniref:hypothetical protein n=1 Tax=Chromobacterium sp. LK1 TaxID=1628193 RepID=UPI00065287F4|nr:hypothetical protein [Chromobacterium sp. LK1]KMN32258.1 hypothetical protein VI26_17710 [Chromobacterium sp. LK1]
MSTPRHIGISIACSLERAYALLAPPEHFPLWASGLAGALRRAGDGWLADTPHGAMPVRFSPLNDYGVLDHWLSPPGQAEVYIPLRLLARDDGCELVLTLFRPPGVDDARFEADAAWMARDLAAAKAWLESQPAS